MAFLKKLMRKTKNTPKRLNPEIYDLAAQGSREALLIYINYCREANIKLDYELFQQGLYNSAEQGNAESLYDIGNFYLNGTLGFPQSNEQAMDYFLRAAKLNHTNAMNQIAFSYLKGRGVEADDKKMLEWYERSAGLGNADAITNIGNIYAHGQGVEKDFDKAKDYFFKAAEQGNANAMNNLAYLYQNGFGVEKDEATAMEWLKKAQQIKAKQPISIGIMDS